MYTLNTQFLSMAGRKGCRRLRGADGYRLWLSGVESWMHVTFCVSWSRILIPPGRTFLCCLRENIDWNLKCIMAGQFSISIYFVFIICVWRGHEIVIISCYTYASQKLLREVGFSSFYLYVTPRIEFRLPGLPDKIHCTRSHIWGSQFPFLPTMWSWLAWNSLRRPGLELRETHLPLPVKFEVMSPWLANFPFLN